MNLTLLSAVDGEFLCDPAQDSRLIKHIQHYGGHSLNDKKQLAYFLSETAVFVDVGAHLGTFSIPLSKIAAHVHACEPTPDTAATLEKNIALNDCSNISLHRCVIGAAPGHARGRAGGKNRGQTFYEPTESQENSIPGKRPSDICDHADVIKIDAEGMELRILEGNREFIAKTRPVLFIEFSRKQLERFGDSALGLHRFFYQLGYKTSFNHGHSHYPASPLDIRTAYLPLFTFARHNRDILAIPKEKAR